jgi:hypothetical protein
MLKEMKDRSIARQIAQGSTGWETTRKAGQAIARELNGYRSVRAAGSGTGDLQGPGHIVHCCYRSIGIRKEGDKKISTSWSGRNDPAQPHRTVF